MQLEVLQVSSGMQRKEPLLPTLFFLSHRRLEFMSAFVTSDDFMPVLISSPNLRTLKTTQIRVPDSDFYLPVLQNAEGLWSPSSPLDKILSSMQTPAFLKSLTLIESAKGLLTTPLQFQGLANVTVRFCELEKSDVSALIRSLPALSALECQLVPGIYDWSWLSHPRLSILNLQVGDPRTDLPLSTMSAPLDSVLRVNSTSLPLLSSFHIHISAHPIYKIHISDLKCLSRLKIVGGMHTKPFADASYYLRIDSCPILSTLDLSSMNLHDLWLKNVKMLCHLQFINCCAPRDLNQIQVDSLRSLAVFIWRVPHEKPYFETLRDLFQAKATEYKPLQEYILDN
jgi:hypothetical protein